MRSSQRKKNESFSEGPPRKVSSVKLQRKCPQMSLFLFLPHTFSSHWFCILLLYLQSLFCIFSFHLKLQWVVKYACHCGCCLCSASSRLNKHLNTPLYAFMTDWQLVRLSAEVKVEATNSSLQPQETRPQLPAKSVQGENLIPKIPTMEYRMFGFAISCWVILTCASYRGKKKSNSVKIQSQTTRLAVCVWLQSWRRLY